MGLGKLLKRQISSGTTRYTATSSSGLTQSWTTTMGGLSPSWSVGDYSGGMSHPPAWRCATLIADTLASSPWHAYRDRGGVREKLDPTPTILESPNPYIRRVDFMSSMVLDLLWHGNALALITDRYANGEPKSMLGVPADNVQVRYPRKSDAAEFTHGFVYSINGEDYPAHDVLHIRGYSRPGALRGFGVLENHLQGLLTTSARQATATAAIGQDGVPSGVLKVPSTEEDLTNEELRQIKERWQSDQSSKSVAVLAHGMEFHPISWSPDEAQLVQAREMTLRETALVFGLDPSWLGVPGENKTYQNVETKGIELLKFSVNGHLTRLEAGISSLLPHGSWAEMNLDSFLRPDTSTRYEAHEKGLRSGFLTPNEVRSMERLPPVTGGDALQPVQAASNRLPLESESDDV